MQAHSLYLHVPFCHHRCSYCDFNTYSGIEQLIPEYVRALCLEIRYIARSCAQKIPVHTIFFGGGTPSLLPGNEVSRVLDTVQKEFLLPEGVEITLEANPGRLTYDYLYSLHQLGVNRISLGMQSADPEDLTLLDRQHDFVQVARAVSMIRKAGFENLSLDLIFGIPYQELARWQRTLDLAISLNPDHISLYALTIESGTPMGHWTRKGLLPAPDSDTSADMYEWAAERLASQGFKQYEISNWARQDLAGVLKTCRHNLQYWRNLPYLGLGAGSHGYAGGMRTANELRPQAYIQKLTSTMERDQQTTHAFPQTPVTVEATRINRLDEMKETMMMGLRLTELGVSGEDFRERFGAALDEVFRDEIEGLVASGLLEWHPENGGVLRLTPRGRLLGNQVFMQFV